MSKRQSDDNQKSTGPILHVSPPPLKQLDSLLSTREHQREYVDIFFFFSLSWGHWGRLVLARFDTSMYFYDYFFFWVRRVYRDEFGVVFYGCGAS